MQGSAGSSDTAAAATVLEVTDEYDNKGAPLELEDGTSGEGRSVQTCKPFEVSPSRQELPSNARLLLPVSLYEVRTLARLPSSPRTS
jgi:hypothetical protein